MIKVSMLPLLGVLVENVYSLFFVAAIIIHSIWLLLSSAAQ